MEQVQLPRRNLQVRCRGIYSERMIGITKKSRTIPAHTYKEAQKGKKKSSVLIQLSGWLRTLDMVPVAGLEPARCRQQWILSPPRLPIPTHRRLCDECYYIIYLNKFQVFFYIFCFLCKIIIEVFAFFNE